jgi:ferric iron reductase protein FhuF
MLGRASGSLSRVTTIALARRAAAELGPYFALEMNADGPGWLDLAILVEDPVVLQERVTSTRALLADRCGVAPDAIDQRASASIFFLGLVARLVSPASGMAAATGIVPVLAIEDVRWQAVDGGPIPMAVTVGRSRSADDLDALAGLLYDHVVSTTVLPVARTVEHAYQLSPKVLLGNVSSALAGAATMVGTARPDLARRATQIAGIVVTKGALAGTGGYLQATPGSRERRFVRNSCCLFYRVPGGGTCADCVLGVRAPR